MYHQPVSLYHTGLGDLNSAASTALTPNLIVYWYDSTMYGQLNHV
jgi:hypothetical protein